jgi:hypothetical protein
VLLIGNPILVINNNNKDKEQDDDMEKNNVEDVVMQDGIDIAA